MSFPVRAAVLGFALSACASQVATGMSQHIFVASIALVESSDISNPMHVSSVMGSKLRAIEVTHPGMKFCGTPGIQNDHVMTRYEIVQNEARIDAAPMSAHASREGASPQKPLFEYTVALHRACDPAGPRIVHATSRIAFAAMELGECVNGHQISTRLPRARFWALPTPTSDPMYTYSSAYDPANQASLRIRMTGGDVDDREQCISSITIEQSGVK